MFWECSLFCLLLFCTSIFSTTIRTESNNVWKEPFTFILGADPQLGMIRRLEFESQLFQSNGSECQGSNNQEELRLIKVAIEKINKMVPRPKFFIICGDFVDDYAGYEHHDKQKKEFMDAMRELDSDIPLICVCGNHDVGNEPTVDTIKQFRIDYGPDYFAFYVNNCAFIVVNDSYFHTYKYDGNESMTKLANEQDYWINEKLYDKIRKYQHAFLFLHHPNMDEDFLKKVHKTRKIRYIFCGHFHWNQIRSKFNDELQIVVTSAMGAPLGKAGSGLRIVKVYEDKIDHQFYEMDLIPSKVDL